MMVAEAWAPRRPDLMAEYVRPDEFHQVFAFDLLLSPWHGPSMRRALIEAFRHGAGRDGDRRRWPTIALNNHDTQRIVTRLGRAGATSPDRWTGDNLRPRDGAERADLDLGTRRARAAAALLLALPGAVYLYQGEELGLPEVLDLPDAARGDPLFIRTGGRQLGRDGCRVPLPWTADPAQAHGFSNTAAAAPWLPQPDGWGRWAADAEAADDASMLALYRRLITARRRILTSDDATLDDDPGHEDLVVLRRGPAVVVCNTGPHPLDVRAVVAGTGALRAVLSSAADADADAATVVGADTTVWLTPR